MISFTKKWYLPQRKAKRYGNNVDLFSFEYYIMIQKKELKRNIPTFNVLIATLGRECLVNMLKSLQNELNKGDCLTIIFDGVKPIQEVYNFKFLCELQIIHQKENLGRKITSRIYAPNRPFPASGDGGHAIREFYKDKLEKRDFIMHADDDDEYLPGSFDKLRKYCDNKDCLYIAKMSFKPFVNRCVPAPGRWSRGKDPHDGGIFAGSNVGTPNGIIPYELNKKGRWRSTVGGDGMFYRGIRKKCKKFQFLDILIYQIRPHEILSILAKKYGLDRPFHTTGDHKYIPAYTTLFQNIRHSVKNLLEIGIGSLENGQMGGITGQHDISRNYKTGNSLKCWSEYFPNSNIYGIDIYAHPELNKCRIKTFVANQNSEDDLKSVMDKINTELDIILDNGSHQGKHQVFSFMHLHQYLVPNGMYVIEGIQPHNIEGFKDLSIFPVDFKEYINKNFKVEYFDTRTTCNRFRRDDFMISFIRK